MRVLLVEDDLAMARSIEMMLNGEGFNVYATDMGEEGLDLGKIYDYDIIVKLKHPFSSSRGCPNRTTRLKASSSAPTTI